MIDFFYLDFSTNIDPNWAIFYSLSFLWSLLSKYTKIPNFSPQFVIRLDRILRIPKKFPWIQHVFTWQEETMRSSISHGLVSKQSLKLPIWSICIELRGIMVNKGQIHMQIRKLMMISSNLIKSNDELMIKIGKNGILWKRTSKCFHGIKNHRIWP